MSVLLDDWQACGDSRCLFLDCYLRMTTSMVRSIDAGEFDDGEWVATLLDRFADYYFVALDQWERDDPAVPIPWRLAHDTARAGTAHPLQHLLLGVNAHIAYDLPLTVVDLLDDEWEAGGEVLRARRHRDYDRVNEVIAATVDEVQDEVLERSAPAFVAADLLLGRVDEWMATKVLSSWRDEAWEHATVLLSMRGGAARDPVRAALESVCADRSRRLLLGDG